MNYLPDSVGTQMFGDLWVMGATQLSQGGDNILLAHFQGDYRPIRQMLNQGKVLRKHTLVNREEFLDYGSGQVKHLHGRDFESSLQDNIDDLASEALFHNVRLY